jgi:hypothetical protein
LKETMSDFHEEVRVQEPATPRKRTPKQFNGKPEWVVTKISKTLIKVGVAEKV